MKYKINTKRLYRDYINMGYSMDDAQYEIEDLLSWFESLPSQMKLYRIVQVEEESDINLKKPGSHYSDNKRDLIGNHCYAVGYGENKFLITVIADKSLVDITETLSNRILYPNENEITLKNKGMGVKIVSVKKVCEEDKIRNIRSRRDENINLMESYSIKNYYNYIVNDLIKKTFIEVKDNDIVVTYPEELSLPWSTRNKIKLDWTPDSLPYLSEKSFSELSLKYGLKDYTEAFNVLYRYVFKLHKLKDINLKNLTNDKSYRVYELIG